MLKLYASQVANIIGATNMVVWLILQGRVPEPVRTTSIIFGGAIVLGSLLLIISKSLSFLKKIDPNRRSYSSRLSLIYRFLVVNIPIVMILVMLALAIIFDQRIFTVAGIFFLISVTSIYFFTKAVFVTGESGLLYFDNYFGEVEAVSAGQIVKISRASSGMLYSIRYNTPLGIRKTRYFFPAGLYFVFKEPNTVKELRKLTQSE